MSRRAGARRALRWLSVGISLAGLAMSAFGMVLLLRGRSAAAGAPARSVPPSTATVVAATTATTEASTTTLAPAAHPGWDTCTNDTDTYRVSFPAGWSTPQTGPDACRILRPVDPGDAGTGYITLARVRDISLAELTSQLALPHADVHWAAHSTRTLDGRTLLHATGTDTIAADLPVVTMYAVEDGRDVVTVTSFSAGMSNDADDELAAIAATVAKP